MLPEDNERQREDGCTVVPARTDDLGRGNVSGLDPSVPAPCPPRTWIDTRYVEFEGGMTIEQTRQWAYV